MSSEKTCLLLSFYITGGGLGVSVNILEIWKVLLHQNHIFNLSNLSYLSQSTCLQRLLPSWSLVPTLPLTVTIKSPDAPVIFYFILSKGLRLKQQMSLKFTAKEPLTFGHEKDYGEISFLRQKKREVLQFCRASEAGGIQHCTPTAQCRCTDSLPFLQTRQLLVANLIVCRFPLSGIDFSAGSPSRFLQMFSK